MQLDPKILPPEMRDYAKDPRKKRTLRDSLLLLLMKVRGNRYTTKAVTDLYFRLATPLTWLNYWRLRWFPKNFPQPVKLNIGSGPQYLAGFVNIEGMLPWKKDLWLDVRRGLPFPDGSVDVIYSCHVFEHFDLRTLRRIFAECHRVLKPGGKIRFITPSLTKAIAAYSQRDLEWYTYEGGANFQSLGGRFNDLMLCQNHHLLLPDFDFFQELLQQAGPWASLTEGGPAPSQALTGDELVLAEGSRQRVIAASLIVEGVKAE